MYAVERRAWIVDHARTEGRVEVGWACAALGVAPETIRRDLNELEREGFVRRVHGGALPVERVGFEGHLAKRAATNHGAKVRIAEAALSLLRGAESVYLDEGSTVQELAEVLRPERPLTVLTCSLPVGMLLAERDNLTVVMLGGRVRGKTLATLEHWAIRMLENHVIDVAVLGANGISLTRGLTCPETSVAAVKVAACRAARRRVLLADHTKLGVDSFCRFAAVEDLATVVTDRGADAGEVRALQGRGVEVLLA